MVLLHNIYACVYILQNLLNEIMAAIELVTDTGMQGLGIVSSALN